MNKTGFDFELLHVDKHCGARLGRLTTPRGVIDLPTFMPVGTCATVKGMTTGLVESTGAQIILGNTYHLDLRPGSDVIEELGGLQNFMGWNGPMLTDSGGFQVFSLAQLTKISENGATFNSHIDGSKVELTPERSVQIQQELGSDIAMVFDHVIELPNSRELVKDAMERTIRWAKRSQDAHTLNEQIQFAIVQGGLDSQLRVECAKQLIDLEFPGYAIGGLSVGEPPPQMYEMLDVTCPILPQQKPRYLMGVGRPQDLLEAVRRGVDMFDCVMPTRNGRNAMAFTDKGHLKLRNAVHERDPRPLQAEVKTKYSHLSRAYIRHLFKAGEMMGPILLSLHNLAYYQRLMRQAREAIANDAFMDYFRERMAGWVGKSVD
ncbi:MAG: tRNA guanosine(34) transglycosylase Tgt [Mariniblastus sp.]|nr:tRNA guanosine(34) transglycosylase Tgt [Mariniblastus sp.]